MAGVFFIGLVKNLNGVICVHHDGRSAFEISFNGHDCFDKHHSHTNHQDQGFNNKDSCQDITIDYNLNTVFVLKKFFYLTTASIPIYFTQKITEHYSLKPVIRLFYERLCLKTLKTVILRL